MVQILRVAPEHVMQLWPQVQAILQPAINAHPPGMFDAEDVRLRLMNLSAHLWIEWADIVNVAVVTQFVTYPKSVWLSGWLVGKRLGARFDFQPFHDVLRDFAKRSGCAGLEMTGARNAWGRKLSSFMRIEGLVLRSPF